MKKTTRSKSITKISRTPKVASRGDDLFEEWLTIIGGAIVHHAAPIIGEKIAEAFNKAYTYLERLIFPSESNTPISDSTKVSKGEGKIISADFSGLGDDGWWEILGVNINASEEEVHEAVKKILASKKPIKSTSLTVQKEIGINRKRVLGAYVIALAAIRAKND